jgi:hypothetical protein
MTCEMKSSLRNGLPAMVLLFMTLFFLLALVVFTGAGCAQIPNGSTTPAPSSTAPAAGSPQRSLSDIKRPDVGFTSKEKLAEHFVKHGGEFGKITQQEYLQVAQELRDCSAGGDVLEYLRKDGTGGSRYDRTSGVFIAFNADGTLRTCFKPNDGEQYFWRQSRRSHSRTHRRERQKNE